WADRMLRFIRGCGCQRYGPPPSRVRDPNTQGFFVRLFAGSGLVAQNATQLTAFATVRIRIQAQATAAYVFIEAAAATVPAVELLLRENRSVASFDFHREGAIADLIGVARQQIRHSRPIGHAQLIGGENHRPGPAGDSPRLSTEHDRWVASDGSADGRHLSGQRWHPHGESQRTLRSDSRAVAARRPALSLRLPR